MHLPLPEPHGNQPGKLQAPRYALRGLPVWPRHHRMGRAAIRAALIHSLTPAKCRRQAPDDPRPATAAPSMPRPAECGRRSGCGRADGRARRPGTSAPRRAAACAVQRLGVGGVMLRSPISTRGPGKPRRSRISRRSCTRFQPGTNDRWVLATVSGPERGVDPRDHRRPRLLMDDLHPARPGQIHREPHRNAGQAHDLPALGARNRDSSAMP